MEMLADLPSLPPHISSLLEESCRVIDGCFELFGENVALSFNAGKDSIVLLHLVRLVMARRGMVKDKGVGQLKFVYFHSDTFDEIHEFRSQVTKQYGISTIEYECSFKEGLADLIESHGVKAVFMGTRRDDPHGGSIQDFSLTSPGWPTLMRCNPILDWGYVSVWDFIKHFNFSYCSLYDQGYTSIGDKNETVPNPLLALEDGGYLPAHQLKDGGKERDGRVLTRRRRSEPQLMRPERVGVLVIGDEILTGQTKDVNSQFLAKELHSLGLELERIEIVPDCVNTIGDCVKRMSSAYDIVFTSGGIGLTHDDCTVEAIAKAFQVPLERHKEFENRLKTSLGEKATENVLKFCDLPRGTHIIWTNDEDPFGQAVFRNIYIFPGVPKLFAKKFEVIKEVFRDKPYQSGSVKIHLYESEFVDTLSSVVNDNPEVRIGSYPIENQDCKTLIFFECKEKKLVDKAMKEFLLHFTDAQVCSKVSPQSR